MLSVFIRYMKYDTNIQVNLFPILLLRLKHRIVVRVDTMKFHGIGKKII